MEIQQQENTESVGKIFFKTLTLKRPGGNPPTG